MKTRQQVMVELQRRAAERYAESTKKPFPECRTPVHVLDSIIDAFEVLGMVVFPIAYVPYQGQERIADRIVDMVDDANRARKAIADVLVNDAFQRMQHGVHEDYFRWTLGDGYASRIVMALEKAGFKIVRAEP